MIPGSLNDYLDDRRRERERQAAGAAAQIEPIAPEPAAPNCGTFAISTTIADVFGDMLSTRTLEMQRYIDAAMPVFVDPPIRSDVGITWADTSFAEAAAKMLRPRKASWFSLSDTEDGA